MAYKQKGFPAHKGSKQFSGYNKSKAVFLKHEPGHTEEPPEDGIEYGETTWGDWTEGETTNTDSGTTRTDWREGTRSGEKVERRAETPEEKAAYEQYLQDVKDGKVKRNTKYDNQNLREENVVDTSVSAPKGILFFNEGTSNIRTGGSAADVGYTGSMDLKGVNEVGMSQAVSHYTPEIYKNGQYQGRGEKVDVNSLPFSDDEGFQQLLTNFNFELSVLKAQGGEGAWRSGSTVDKARKTEYGKALSSIIGAESPEAQLAAYKKFVRKHPELLQGDGPSDNPLQNQSSGDFVSGQAGKDASARANGASGGNSGGGSSNGSSDEPYKDKAGFIHASF
tara:strand:- start:866 stop:1873 length:1008 start_codon:yes stop_codon:yes gene_type:complete